MVWVLVKQIPPWAALPVTVGLERAKYRSPECHFQPYSRKDALGAHYRQVTGTWGPAVGMGRLCAAQGADNLVVMNLALEFPHWIL